MEQRHEHRHAQVCYWGRAALCKPEMSAANKLVQKPFKAVLDPQQLRDAISETAGCLRQKVV